MEIVTLSISKKYTDSQIKTWLTSGSTYKGTWNAATNTPRLTQGSGTSGDYYEVATPGTWDNIKFLVGDRVIFSSSTHKWERVATGVEEDADTPRVIKFLKQGDTFPTTRVSGKPLVVGDWCSVDSTATLPFTIGSITFDNYRDKVNWTGTSWQLEDFSIGKTHEVQVFNPAEESLSGTATFQNQINKEVKEKIEEHSEKFSYLHTQATASKVWNITHNLGYYPSVTIVDSAGEKVFSGIQYPSINQISLIFSAELSGKAYLS